MSLNLRRKTLVVWVKWIRPFLKIIAVSLVIVVIVLLIVEIIYWVSHRKKDGSQPKTKNEIMTASDSVKYLTKEKNFLLSSNHGLKKENDQLRAANEDNTATIQVLTDTVAALKTALAASKKDNPIVQKKHARRLRTIPSDKHYSLSEIFPNAHPRH